MALKRAVSTQIFHHSTEQGAPRSPICTMFKFQKRGATLSGELHLLSGTCQERQWTPPPYHIPCMSVSLKGDNTLRAQVVSSQWTLCREGPGYNFTCQECWHWPKVFVLFANWLITNFQTCKSAGNIYVLVLIMVYIMVVVCCSVTHLCPTLCDLMDCSTPHFPVLHYLPEFAQTRVHWISDAIQPSHPLSPPFPPALSLSQHQGLFQWVGSLHQVAKVLELQFSIGPSGEYSGLISFRINRFDLLVVQGTLKSLLQHHSLKASVLWHSAFFMVQLSYPYRTTGKNHSFDYSDPCEKMIFLLFNMIYWFVTLKRLNIFMKTR